MKKIILPILFCLCSILPAFPQTWNSDIGCIVYSHCSSCHRPGGIGPFSLMSYFEAFQRKDMIAQSVQTRMMPPFPPRQDRRPIAHANTLSQTEINAIVAWAGNNAPLGSGNEPPAPEFTSAAELENPDFEGRIPVYNVNTPVNDDYRVFVIPVENSSEKFIEAVEVIPGNREIVHHVLVFTDTSRIPMQLDSADPGPGYSSFGSSGSPSAVLLAGYAPGQKAYFFPPGFGGKLLPGSRLCLQIHYPGGLSNQKDSTSIRLRYRSSTNGIRELFVLPALNHGNSLLNGPLFIPANTVKTFYSQTYVPADVTVTGINPHMHLLGKSIRAYGIKPGGDTIHLIDIPEWHFHWQGFYNFKKPVFLPQGTILRGEATYDNTISNIYNPNSPPQNVSQGEGTADEMMLIFFIFAPFQAADTSLVVDAASHWPHDLLACSSVTGLDLPPSGEEEKELPQEEVQSWMILSADGRRLMNAIAEGQNPEESIRKLPAGLYGLRLQYSNGKIQCRKIFISGSR